MFPAVALLLMIGTQTTQTPPLNLDTLVRKTLPKPEEEKWLKIPWRTHLMRARQEAVTAGKPIFLWIMVGNPQGCT